jgi:hypothetical protein
MITQIVPTKELFLKCDPVMYSNKIFVTNMCSYDILLQYFLIIFSSNMFLMPISVAARSKAWICGRSLAGIVGSNPPRGMDVCRC